MPGTCIVPTVSVIIPTHDRRAMLGEAIDSVLAQTFRDFELIVVDDGSTDGTQGMLRSRDDPRLIALWQHNRGVAAARNMGVAHARAPFLAFLDSDDLWLPRKLEVQLRYLERHPRIAICQTEELWVRHGRRVNPMQKHQKRSGWIFRECLPRCIISPSAVMLRRESFKALGGFDEMLPACEDYDLWLRAALRYEIATLAESLIVKRGGHDDQLSRQWGLDRYRIAALEKCLADPLLADDLRPLVQSEIARRASIVAHGARKRGNAELALLYERKCGLLLP
jgi:glycosyltransferase involved in cell wall biosynthesis